MENVMTFHSLTRIVMKGAGPAYSCALVTCAPWTDGADSKCGISVYVKLNYYILMSIC